MRWVSVNPECHFITLVLAKTYCKLRLSWALSMASTDNKKIVLSLEKL